MKGYEMDARLERARNSMPKTRRVDKKEQTCCRKAIAVAMISKVDVLPRMSIVWLTEGPVPRGAAPERLFTDRWVYITDDVCAITDVWERDRLEIGPTKAARRNGHARGRRSWHCAIDIHIEVSNYIRRGNGCAKPILETRAAPPIVGTICRYASEGDTRNMVGGSSL